MAVATSSEHAPGSPVSLLLLVDFAPRAILWAWSRLMIGGRALTGVPGLRFAKVLGSGHDGSFGLRPSATHQGLFCHFESDAQADRFLRSSALVAAYRSHAREFASVKLHAYASRGQWAGQTLPVTVDAPSTGPIAALTRASIRPAAAWSFWRNAPPANRALQQASGCRLAAGLGEAPLLRQATFSVWDDVRSMDDYARSGAHLAAIRAAHTHGYFSESMFVRFVPSELRGRWKGRELG